MTNPVTIGDCTVTFIDAAIDVTIYSLSDESGAVMYVGSTTQSIKHRVRAHVLAAKNGSQLPVHQWIRERKSFVVTTLGVTSSSDREAREKHWIAVHKGKLLNLTDGGPGMSGHRFAGTEHALRIQAAIRSGAYFDCLRCGTKFWRKRVEIQKGHNKFCSRVCSNARHKEVAHVA
jgi:hypothetical protein